MRLDPPTGLRAIAPAYILCKCAHTGRRHEGDDNAGACEASGCDCSQFVAADSTPEPVHPLPEPIRAGQPRPAMTGGLPTRPARTATVTPVGDYAQRLRRRVSPDVPASEPSPPAVVERPAAPVAAPAADPAAVEPEHVAVEAIDFAEVLAAALNSPDPVLRAQAEAALQALRQVSSHQQRAVELAELEDERSKVAAILAEVDSKIDRLRTVMGLPLTRTPGGGAGLCDVCGKPVKSGAGRHAHMRNHHPGANR